MLVPQEFKSFSPFLQHLKSGLQSDNSSLPTRPKVTPTISRPHPELPSRIPAQGETKLPALQPFFPKLSSWFLQVLYFYTIIRAIITTPIVLEPQLGHPVFYVAR